jgi:hypothetical protein
MMFHEERAGRMDGEDLRIGKVGQAYQVIGSCCCGVRPTEAEWQRALGYFADEERYDPDFLPWPLEQVPMHEPVR